MSGILQLFTMRLASPWESPTGQNHAKTLVNEKSHPMQYDHRNITVEVQISNVSGGKYLFIVYAQK